VALLQRRDPFYAKNIPAAQKRVTFYAKKTLSTEESHFLR
ncbi:MAG: hypothetical protein JWM68_2416, partial [Verrucomicrobiales bacterium]|nr:hypothetical protein [Verrucomicrobiales bacterium]